MAGFSRSNISNLARIGLKQGKHLDLYNFPSIFISFKKILIDAKVQTKRIKTSSGLDSGGLRI